VARHSTPELAKANSGGHVSDPVRQNAGRPALDRALGYESSSSNFWNFVLRFVDDRCWDGCGRKLLCRAGHQGIKAARSQYDAWLDIVARAEWRHPEDVKASYPKASILKAGRVVFNIKGNDYRPIARVQYEAGVLAIRFFGTHAEYDKADAETV
jgi:mRNA interferase HigB